MLSTVPGFQFIHQIFIENLPISQESVNSRNHTRIFFNRDNKKSEVEELKKQKRNPESYFSWELGHTGWGLQFAEPTVLVEAQ